MTVYQVKVKGASITFGAVDYTDQWLHFGCYRDGEAQNIAHNLNAVFGVRVQLVNTITEEITEYRTGE